MPLIRCDYAPNHIGGTQLRTLNSIIYDLSAKLCNYNEEDARNKISIFNTSFGPLDHSTAAAEIEVRAKMTVFDHPTKTRQEVRAEWLRTYEEALVPFAKSIGLKAPIIFTITFEDWEVAVVTAAGPTPN